MKKRILFIIMALLLICGVLYAANGDLLVSGKVGIGPSNNAGMLDIVSDQSSRAVNFTYYNNDVSPPTFWGKKARGSLSAPAAVVAGDNLISINAAGYGNSLFSGNVGRIIIGATQDFDDTHHGTYMAFGTANNDSATQSEKMRIDQDGKVGIGTQTPNAKLHVNGNVILGSVPAPQANKVLCWISTGTSTPGGTIGYCTGPVDQYGTCSSCTAIN